MKGIILRYLEFANKTFWGRFVDNLLFFTVVNIFEAVFYLVIDRFDWTLELATFVASIVLSLIFAAIGFGWTKLYKTGLKGKK